MECIAIVNGKILFMFSIEDTFSFLYSLCCQCRQLSLLLSTKRSEYNLLVA